MDGLNSEELYCVIEALNTPESAVSHFGQTTSLNGRQTESWGGITMSWSYHPDRGLDAVYTIG